jgi:hypothetical protein
VVDTTSSGSISQPNVSAFAEVTTNTTINAGPFVDLLTVPINLPPGGSGNLEILATASAEATDAGSEVRFQLLLDGIPLGPGAANGASFTVSPSGESDTAKESVSIFKRVANVSPGVHIVKLQWRVIGAEATASILVSTGFEHGSLRVSEDASTESNADANVTFQVLVFRFPQQSSTTTT